MDNDATHLLSQQDRKNIWFELISVLAIVVFPPLLSSINSLVSSNQFNRAEPSSFTFIYQMVLNVSRIVPVVFFIYLAGNDWHRFGLRKLRWNDPYWALILLAAQLGISIAVRAASAQVGLVHYSYPEFLNDVSFGMVARAEPLLYVFYVIVYALYIEFIFRSYLITRLTDLGFNGIAAVVLAATASWLRSFSPSVPHVAITIAIGICCGYAFLKLRSVWPLALAHCAYTILSLQHLL